MKPVFKEFPAPIPDQRAFRMNQHLIVLIQRIEPDGWHLSISHPQRYPTWDEIHAARYGLLPDEVTMGMLLPPRGEYVNIHPNCFHLWQIRDNQLSAVPILRAG